MMNNNTLIKSLFLSCVILMGYMIIDVIFIDNHYSQKPVNCTYINISNISSSSPPLLKSNITIDYIKSMYLDMFKKFRPNGLNGLDELTISLSNIRYALPYYGLESYGYVFNYIILITIRIIIDIGANIGQTTAKYLQLYTDFYCRQHMGYVARNGGIYNSDCITDRDDMIIYSFEPLPKNYDRICEASSKLHWSSSKWIVFQAAISDKTGNTTIWTSGIEGDQQASLDPSILFHFIIILFY